MAALPTRLSRRNGDAALAVIRHQLVTAFAEQWPSLARSAFERAAAAGIEPAALADAAFGQRGITRTRALYMLRDFTAPSALTQPLQQFFQELLITSTAITRDDHDPYRAWLRADIAYNVNQPDWSRSEVFDHFTSAQARNAIDHAVSEQMPDIELAQRIFDHSDRRRVGFGIAQFERSVAETRRSAVSRSAHLTRVGRIGLEIIDCAGGLRARDHQAFRRAIKTLEKIVGPETRPEAAIARADLARVPVIESPGADPRDMSWDAFVSETRTRMALGNEQGGDWGVAAKIWAMNGEIERARAAQEKGRGVGR
ncbi:MAG: hypothetical protein ACOYNI_12290 [Acidimicrobiia bacterium]